MSKEEEQQLKTLVEETRKLVEENNKILHSLKRIGLIELVLRILWYAILVGVPFAIYFYVLGPYLEALGASYGQMSEGFQALPGFKALGSMFGQHH